jgi:hypothetical protein
LKWILQARDLNKKYPQYKINKPNTHLFIEFLIRYLPSIRNAKFIICERYEAAHYPNKIEIKQVRKSNDMNPELHALNHFYILEMFRYICNRGSWGDNLEFSAGDKILDFVQQVANGSIKCEIMDSIIFNKISNKQVQVFVIFVYLLNTNIILMLIYLNIKNQNSKIKNQKIKNSKIKKSKNQKIVF